MQVGRPLSRRVAAIAGMQAALTLLIAVSLIYVSPWSHLVAFPALGALASLFGRYESLSRRRRIVFVCAVLMTASVLLPSLVSYAGATSVHMVLLLAVFAGLLTIAVSRWGLGGPGPVMFVFAVGAVLGPVDSWGVIVERTVATVFGGAVAWVVCALTDVLRAEQARASGAPPARRPPLRSQLIAASRIVVGAALAGLITYAAGWQHPSWAVIGATAVMQGGHLHITMNRALQRMAGTVVGSLLVWAILITDPPFWQILAFIVVFQFVTEVLIGYNYALGQVTVTPMALLMTHLASPIVVSAGVMPVERVFDTIVGAAIGIVLAVVFSSLDDRAYLAKHHRERKKADRA